MPKMVLKLHFRASRTCPDLSLLYGPTVCHSCLLKVGQMPVLQFRQRTLDIQIAVFFVEIKYVKKLIPFSQLIVEIHNFITSDLFVVNCVVQNIHCHSYASECVLCIHLQELPKTTPVSIKLPLDLFGDMMMVLEFLSNFGNLFDIKDEFPSGLTFGNVFAIDILCIQSDQDIDVIIMM